MSIWSGLAAAGVSLIGDVFANERIDKQADAAADAQNRSIDLQRDIYNSQLRLLQPQIEAGNTARGVIMDAQGYGGAAPAQSQDAFAPITTGQGPSGANPVQYLIANPDVMEAWNTNAGGVRGRFNNAEEWANYHIQTHGIPEGRTIPQYGQANMAGASPTANPAPASTPSAQDAFEGSMHHKYAMEMNPFIMDGINSQKGALGSLYSGSTTNAAVDALARNGYGAFLDWNNTNLSLSNAGQVAGQSAIAAGDAFGSKAGTAMGNIGQIRSSSYGAQNDAFDIFNNAGRAYGEAGGKGFGSAPDPFGINTPFGGPYN